MKTATLTANLAAPHGRSLTLLSGAFNITLDAVVGAIPFLGTVFDFMFKANKRNLTLAIEHFEEGKHQGSILPYLIPIIIILIALFAFVVYITIIAFRFFFDILNQIQL